MEPVGFSRDLRSRECYNFIARTSHSRVLITGYEMKCVNLFLYVSLLAMDSTTFSTDSSIGLNSGETSVPSQDSGSAESICKFTDGVPGLLIQLHNCTWSSVML